MNIHPKFYLRSRETVAVRGAQKILEGLKVLDGPLHALAAGYESLLTNSKIHVRAELATFRFEGSFEIGHFDANVSSGTGWCLEEEERQEDDIKEIEASYLRMRLFVNRDEYTDASLKKVLEEGA